MRKPLLTALLAFSLPFTAHMTESVIPQDVISRNYIRMDLEKKLIPGLSYNVLIHIPVSSPIPTVYIKRVSDLYGPRERHPVLKIPSFHSGIDFSAKLGTPVLSTANGMVVDIEYSQSHIGYGNKIMLKHGDEYHTVYAHLQDVYVKKGDTVVVGQEIGTVGTTGLSTGPHLHYEILRNRHAIDPLSLYQIDLEDEDTASKYLAILSDFESATLLNI